MSRALLVKEQNAVLPSHRANRRIPVGNLPLWESESKVRQGRQERKKETNRKKKEKKSPKHKKEKGRKKSNL